ncbi:MAG: hypothetical protein M1826_000787 [Phylliscum demangeonii]|nr:MAG: hypothetical protein M1826_000787 [Phylliscum demangeonii]
MASSKVVEGIFAINKPPSISSAQVLRDLQSHFNPSKLFGPWIEAEQARREAEAQQRRWGRRRRKKQKTEVKIGHGGTLDPLATGVLIAGIGAATKQLGRFLTCSKTYEAVVLFGVATDSYDRLGKVIGHAATDHLTRDTVCRALDAFRGELMQRPPIFSALRVQGKRLYEYAREGKTPPVEINERPVKVHELELLDWWEGGQHPHRWPTEPADAKHKTLAEEFLHIKPDAEDAVAGGGGGGSGGGSGGSEHVATASRAHGRMTRSAMADLLKRKRDSDPDPDADSDEELVFDTHHSARRRRKTVPDEALMSGGLAPPTPAAAGVDAEPSSTPVVPSTPTSTSAAVNLSTISTEGTSTTASALVPSSHSSTTSTDANDHAHADANANANGHISTTPTATSTPPPAISITAPHPPTLPFGLPPAARIRMTVSSGFYVRSLCHDLGAALGSLGIMAELVRTRQAQFSLGQNVFEYAELAKGEEAWAPQVERLLRSWMEEEEQEKEGDGEGGEGAERGSVKVVEEKKEKGAEDEGEDGAENGEEKVEVKEVKEVKEEKKKETL